MGLARRGFLKGLASVPFLGILAENHMDKPEPMRIDREPEPDFDWDEPINLGAVEGSGYICATGCWDYGPDHGNPSGFIACSG